MKLKSSSKSLRFVVVLSRIYFVCCYEFLVLHEIQKISLLENEKQNEKTFAFTLKFHS